MKIVKIFGFITLSLLTYACKRPAEIAETHFQQGKVYFEQKQYDKAGEEFMLTKEFNANHSEAFYYLGLIDEINKRWQPMFDNLAHAVSINPSLMPAHLKLANIEALAGLLIQGEKEVDIVLKSEPDNLEALIIKATILSKKNASDETLTYVNRVLDADPSNIRAINIKATALMQQKKYNEALETLDNILKSKPNEISFHITKLQVHQAQNDNQAIEEDYVNLIKRIPDNLEFRYALIKIYSETNRYADADAMFKSILSKNPKDLNIKKSYIEFIEKHNISNAITKTREFINQNPDAIDLYIILAKLYIKSQQLNEAKQTLNFILEHKWQKDSISSVFEFKIDSKQILQAKAMLASIALESHDEAESTRLINEILDIDSLHYDALLLKAKIKITNNQLDEALAILRITANEYPDKDDQFVLMAKIYLLQKSPGLANEAFRKAIDINPGNFEAVIPVASKMIEHFDLKRAEELLENALKTKPDQTEALELLEKIHKLR